MGRKMPDFDFSLTSAWGAGEELLDFDPKQFAFGGKSDGVESARYLMPKVYDNSVTEKVAYDKARDFVNGLPEVLEDGFRLFAFVSGNFVFGDVLEALVDTGRVDPRIITVQTLSLSEHNIDSLQNVLMMCPDLERMRLVISEYFYSHERYPGHLVPYLYECLDIEDLLEVAYASVHTKLITVETTDGRKIVIDGSANLRSSRNIEQFRLEVDAGLYEFVDGFTDKIFSAYSVINKNEPRPDKPKAIRSGAFWKKLKKEGVANG